MSQGLSPASSVQGKRECSVCHIEERDETRIKTCKCGEMLYCSKACQKEHWFDCTAVRVLVGTRIVALTKRRLDGLEAISKRSTRISKMFIAQFHQSKNQLMQLVKAHDNAHGNFVQSAWVTHTFYEEHRAKNIPRVRVVSENELVNWLDICDHQLKTSASAALRQRKFTDQIHNLGLEAAAHMFEDEEILDKASIRFFDALEISLMLATKNNPPADVKSGLLAARGQLLAEISKRQAERETAKAEGNIAKL